MVVVSPFVGVRSQSEQQLQLSDLLKNRFFQNQLLRQGTSLTGPALVAAGSMMARAGDAPKTSFRSHIQRTDTGGKRAFKPYTAHGRSYDRPLGRGGFTHRGGREHGYNTNHKSKAGIKKAPGKSKAGRLLKGAGRSVSKFSAPIGLGLVGYNIHRHGVKETAKQEVQTAYDFSPLGLIDNTFFDGRVMNHPYAQTPIANTLQSVATMAILEALI